MLAPDAIGWTALDYVRLCEHARAGAFVPEELGLVMAAESDLRPDAPDVDGSGAEGLMQFTRDVRYALGWRPGRPEYQAAEGIFGRAPIPIQIDYAAKYLTQWRRRFGLTGWTAPAMLITNHLPPELDACDEGQARRLRAYRLGAHRALEGDEGRDAEDYLVRARNLRRQRLGVFVHGCRTARLRCPVPLLEGAGAPPVLRDVRDVRAVQGRLEALGLDPGPADGVYGERTRGAVTAFQLAHGLRADGWVGPVTWSALARARAEGER